MSRQRRSSLVGGVLILLVGVAILLVELLPGLALRFTWPWLIIGVGVMLLFIGSATGVAALAIPAAVVSGIGGILVYQVVTGDWDSWAYVWSLIPGFVGVGTILSGLLGGDGGTPIQAGAWLILVSVILFALFGSLFGALGFLGQYWPALLILLGVFLLIRPLFGRRS